MRSIFFEANIPKILTTLALKSVWGGAIYAPTAPVKFQDLPEPKLPGPRGVRLRNRMCGICASDLHLLFVDIDPKVAPAAIRGSDILYLGHEVVSDVVEVGDEVTEVSKGDRVAMLTRFLNPTCRSQELDELCRHCIRGDYSLCESRALGKGIEGVGGGWSDGYTCHESEIWKVPDGLSDEEAVMVEPLACSLRAVLRRPPEPGDKVLVLGCGTIGLGVVQALKAVVPDADVFAAARYPHQIEAARKWGAEPVSSKLFDVAHDVTGATIQVGEFSNTTALGGFDVIYDCVGIDATVEQSVRLARAGGAVVIVGVHLKPIKADLTSIWHQEVDLLGSMAHGMETWEGEEISTFDLTAKFLLDGRMTIDGMVTHRYPLEEWKEAIETSLDKKTGCIKVVFEFDD